MDALCQVFPQGVALGGMLAWPSETHTIYWLCFLEGKWVGALGGKGKREVDRTAGVVQNQRENLWVTLTL